MENKHNLKTFPRNAYDCDKGIWSWKEDFEAELRHRIIVLLQHRAGGRYTMFEAGMIYQACLDLGMADTRPGKIGEQETYWAKKLVCSCIDSKEAEEKLKKLLS